MSEGFAFRAAWAERRVGIAVFMVIAMAAGALTPSVAQSGADTGDFGYYRIVYGDLAGPEMMADAGIVPLAEGDWGAYLRLEPERAALIPGLEEIPSRTVIRMEEQGLEIDTSEGYSLAPEWSNSDTELKLVQFVCPCPGDWVESVEGISGPVLRYIGDNAIVVRADASGEREIRKLDYVEWVGPYEPRFKVFGNLMDMTGEIRITATASPDTEIGVMIAELAGLGASNIEDTQYGAATCTVQAWRLASVARLDSVILVEHLPEMKTLLNVGGRIVRAHDVWVNTVSNLPQNIMGQGQIVHIQDTGIDATHRDFLNGPLGDRLENPDSTTDPEYHGTFMAGCVAGNGYDMETYLGLSTSDRVYNSLAASNPAGRGDRMAFAGRAPEATVYFRAGLVSTEWANGYTFGARVFSNSWGPATMSNTYDGTADTFMNSNPGALVLFPAGSDGPKANTVSGAGNGKLVMSVGATENMRPVDFDTSDDPNQIRQMSSRGPVADGRVKPDICEVGTAVYAPKSDDVTEASAPGLYDNLYPINPDPDAAYDYISLQGTSVAAAEASGDAILVRDYLVDVKGIPSPHANLIKTLLIHGADDIGYGYPSFDQGWGRINVRNSICPAAPNVIQWYHSDAGIGSGSWNARTDGGLQTWVVDDTVPLKITMAHWDAVGSGTLTYDLDLVVTSPGGVRYEGNAFKEAWSTPVYTPANWSDAQFPSWMAGAPYDWDTVDDGGDDINNVEIFRIQNPEKGQWNVQVVWKSSTARPFTIAMTGGFNASADANAPSNQYRVSMETERPRVVAERDDFGEAVFTAAPGGSVIVPYWLNNGGTNDDSYTLSAPILPSGFAVSFTPASPVSVGAGERVHGFATVSAGSALAAGTYTLALKALSTGDATAPIAQSVFKFQVDVQNSETPPLLKIADAPVHEDAPSLVSWNSGGVDYVACAYRQEERYGSRVYFKLSSDGGRTWGTPVPVSTPSWSPEWVTITRATSGTYAGRLAIAWDAWNPDGYGGSTTDTRCAYVKVAYADAPYTTWTEVNGYSMGEGRSTGNTYRALNLVWHAPTNAFMIVVEIFGYDTSDLSIGYMNDISVGYKTSANGGATWSTMGWVDPNGANVYYFFPHAVADITGNIAAWFYQRDSSDVAQDRDLSFRYYSGGAWGTYYVCWDTADNLLQPQGVAAPQGVNGNRNYCAVRKGANSDGDMNLYLIWTDDGGATFQTNAGAGYAAGGPVVSRNDYGTRFLMDGDYTDDGYVWWTYQRESKYDPYGQPNIVTVSDDIYGTSPDPVIRYVTQDSYWKCKQRTANLTESPGKVLVGWNQITKQAGSDILCSHIFTGFESATDTLGPIVEDATADKLVCYAGDIVTVAANINDWPTGGSNVGGAKYTVDNSTWVAMLPSDGNNNTPVEAAYIPISTSGWSPGWHWIFIIGFDSGINYGEPLGFRIYVNPPDLPWAVATGPAGASSNQLPTVTYNFGGGATAVEIWYTGNGGASWFMFGTDASIDGSWQAAYALPSGTYYWNARANGESDTDLEAGPYIVDLTPPEPPTDLIVERYGIAYSMPEVEGFQASNGGSALSTDLVLTAPTGITAGELLLLVVGNSDNTDTDQFSNNLAGWNFVADAGDTVCDAHVGAFWRVASGTEGTVTVVAQSADYWFGWYIRISGASATAPIDVSNFVASAGAMATHVIPSVTTTVYNCLAFYGLSFDGGDGTFSVSGTGWTESDEQSSTVGAAYAGGCWGTKQQAAAGATGNASVNCGVSDGAAYFQLAVRGGAYGTTLDNTLNWTASTSPDVDHYSIYRSDSEYGSYALIGSSPAINCTYQDDYKGQADAITWWYRVRAVDAVGNEELNTDAAPEPWVPTPPCSIDLSGKPANSWVFVSYPYDVSGDIATVLDDSNLGDGGTSWSVAKWFDPQDPADPWKTYRFGSSMNDLTAINNHMGVWLWLTANAGDQYLSLGQYGEVPTGSSIPLYAGWNMVGYPSGTPRPASATLPAQTDWVSIWKASSPYIQDYADKSLVTMSQGNAYWVHAVADCMWNLDGAAPAPLLTVVKTAPPTAHPGDFFNYTIEIANIGTATAYNITVTDTYPAGIGYEWSVPMPDMGDNVWFIPEIAPAQIYYITITVSLFAGAGNGTLVNLATAEYEDAGGNPRPPVSDTASTLVVNPLMHFMKSAPANALPGETVNYTLSYQNIGTDTAYSVFVTEVYPPDVIFVSSFPAPTMGNDLWFLGDIPPGMGGAITITVTISPAASGTVTNSAYLDYENLIGMGWRVWANASTVIQAGWGPVQNLNTGEYFGTIQAAIDDPDTLNGHTIAVSPGTYHEHVSLTKSLHLLSETQHAAVIDADGTGDAVRITANSAAVSDFTVRNAGNVVGAMDKDAGIELYNVRDCYLHGNMVTGNGLLGIWLYKTALGTNTNNTIEANNCSNNQYGVYSEGSTANRILGNSMFNNSRGLYQSSGSHDVAGNRFSGNGFGILYSGASNNQIYDNVFSENYYGVYISSGTGNSVHHNEFLANTVSAVDEAANSWDDGYPSGGNHWSDYFGADICTGPGQDIPGADGLGDTPYTIDADSQDGYPLMPYWPMTGRVRNLDTGEYFETIQAAVDDNDTVGGHRIEVQAGTFLEAVTVHKSLNINGAGPNQTVIDGSLGGGPGVRLTGAGSRLSNFTVTGWAGHAGILVQADNVTVCDNVITQSATGIAVGSSGLLTAITDSTADFDSGTKSVRDECFETETFTDNPAMPAGYIGLGSMYGDRFNTPSADALTWKWERAYPSGDTPATTTTASISSGALNLYSYTPTGGTRGLNDVNLKEMVAGNYDIRLRVTYSGMNQNEYVGIKLSINADNSHYIQFGYDTSYYIAGGAIIGGSYSQSVFRPGTDNDFLFRLVRNGTYLRCYYMADGTADVTTDTGWTQLNQQSVGTLTFPLWPILYAGTSQFLPSTINGYFDNFYVKQGQIENAYMTSGIWTSETMPMSPAYLMRNCTVVYSGASVNNFIESMQWVMNGSVVASYDHRIESGTGLVITESDLTNGSFADITEPYCIVLHFAGNGSGSPVVDSIVHYAAARSYFSGTVLTGNGITDNGVGVEVATLGLCSIHANRFLYNGIQATDIFYAATWDNGYPEGGNQWSDYHGSDLYSGPGQNLTGSDGIGDTPYTGIQGGSVDRYPLVEYAGASPDITVSKTANITLVMPRQLIDYTVHYNNWGSATATHVWLNDTLPAGVTFVAANPMPDTVDGLNLSWYFSEVAFGMHSLVVTVMVDVGVPKGTALVNTVTCECRPGGPDSTDWANVTVSWMLPPYAIYGYVRDNFGLAISGATVHVLNNNTGEYLTGITNALGQYSVDLSNLPSGYMNGDFIEVTTLNPPGGYNSTYVDGIIIVGEQVDITVNVSDATAPSHSNEAPPSGGTSGNSTPIISVDVTDLQTGVNASTIKFYIQGFSVMYDLQAIGNGYRVSYWHEAGFTTGTVVSCRIVARDYVGNLLDWTWSFTVP